MRQKIEDMPTWKILGIIGSIVVVAVSVGMWAASVANSGTDAVKSINALREEQSQHWAEAAAAAVKAADEQKTATAEVSRATQAVAVELAKVSAAHGERLATIEATNKANDVWHASVDRTLERIERAVESK